MSSEGTLLPSPPFETISKIRFSPSNQNHLLVSSWDSTVRLYEVGDNPEQKVKFEHRAAVLDCCFEDGDHGFSGGLDGTVRHLNLKTESATPLGSHNDSISALAYSQSTKTVFTGSWDRNIKQWDSRSPSGSSVTTTKTPERVYHMDLAGNTLVVAMASRLFQLYDIRRMDLPSQERESSLKYMTRSLACMADGKGYATASVEGRIAVEYLDSAPEIQNNKYAFKCHRQTVGDVDHVWPVNALAFHPVYNTFASGGSDCTVSIWDHKVKKRLRQFPKYQAPVASIAFSHDGTKLAVACSYTWDAGEEGHKMIGSVMPSIVVRNVGDEVRPKDSK